MINSSVASALATSRLNLTVLFDSFIPFPISDADDSSISFASLTGNCDPDPKPAGDANKAASSSASPIRMQRRNYGNLVMIYYL